MSKGRLEREVQAGILAYLAIRTDIFWWRANIQAGMAPSGQYMRSGGIPGAPDIQGIQFPLGRFFGIETKREFGGVFSPDQLRWKANCEAHGGIYIGATAIEAVQIGLGPCMANIPKQKRKRVYHRP